MNTKQIVIYKPLSHEEINPIKIQIRLTEQGPSWPKEIWRRIIDQLLTPSPRAVTVTKDLADHPLATKCRLEGPSWNYNIQLRSIPISGHKFIIEHQEEILVYEDFKYNSFTTNHIRLRSIITYKPMKMIYDHLRLINNLRASCTTFYVILTDIAQLLKLIKLMIENNEQQREAYLQQRISTSLKL